MQLVEGEIAQNYIGVLDLDEERKGCQEGRLF